MLLRQTFLAAFALAFCACTQEEPDESTVDNLAADPNAKNYALVFTGSNDGVPGVDRDPANIAATLGPGNVNNLNFQFIKGEHATTAQILSASQQIAARMLTESPNGTLFWFISSHGADDGSIISSNGCFYFEEVARAMRLARRDVPLRRLVVLIDTCYAGQSVIGSKAIQRNSGSSTISCDGSGGGLPGGVQRMLQNQGLGLTDGDSEPSIRPSSKPRFYSDVVKDLGADATREQRSAAVTSAGVISDLKTANYATNTANDVVRPNVSAVQPGSPIAQNNVVPQSQVLPVTPGLYQEAIVMGSSAPAEESGDGGEGGVGTVAFRNAVRLLRQQRPNARVIELFQAMRQLAVGQTPVFHVDPPQVANTLLFDGLQTGQQPVSRTVTP